MGSLFRFIGLFVISTAALADAAPADSLKAIQRDPSALAQAVAEGKKAAFFCANCHGEAGISIAPETPNLAGQNPVYLLEQIRKFGTGERKDKFMEGMIKLLKDQERIQISLYYASLSPKPSPADASQQARGKAIFTKTCQSCHGERAQGQEGFPRLAGQKVPYLKASITRYRDPTGLRNNPQMRAATAALTDADVHAVAHYLAQLP